MNFISHKPLIPSTLIAGLLLLGTSGCGGGKRAEDSARWEGFLSQLVDLDQLARLDVPATKTLTTADPTGGNEDYGHFVRKGPAGWWVFADLKGPGCVYRFWMTGAPANSRLRFYFDGERRPSIDATVIEFFGKQTGFMTPLSNHEQGCWYSYIPMPYAKRLVVMASDMGTKPDEAPHFFYQINYRDLPQGQAACTFPREFSAEDKAALEKVRYVWRDGTFSQDLPAGLETVSETLTIEPGKTSSMAAIRGPASIRVLEITPDLSRLGSMVERNRMLRDLSLKITWDEAPAPSVATPLGDFFGSFGRTIRFNAMFAGMTNDTFFARFPMPFRSAAQVGFENNGTSAVSVTVDCRVARYPAWTNNFGYFHACWQKSGPQDVGTPHTIVKTEGRGKYVGCILNVVSQDPSWWQLEGDETIRIDNEAIPQWKGTGLEDYFNGGWYYRTIMARPLNGLLQKSPFRTLQYRFHLTDAVLFDSAIDMQFERGAGNVSKGWMESVAYYYMDVPHPVSLSRGTPGERYVPADPFEERTFVYQVVAQERLGDFRGAHDRVAEFLERHPQSPMAPILRLRQIAYRERELGFERVRRDYEQFIRDNPNQTEAVRQAKLLLWMHADKANALLGAYCNARTKVYLDGRLVSEVDHPLQLAVTPVQLSPGRHVIAAEAQWMRAGPWLEFYLRTHGGNIASGSGWKWTLTPRGEFRSLDYDDSSWNTVSDRPVPSDYPEEPYFEMAPNAFVGMQSELKAMELPEWTKTNDRVALRKVFDVRDESPMPAGSPSNTEPVR